MRSDWARKRLHASAEQGVWPRLLRLSGRYTCGSFLVLAPVDVIRSHAQRTRSSSQWEPLFHLGVLALLDVMMA